MNIKRVMSNALCLFWLTIVTPFFGVIPLLMMFGVSIGYGFLYRLEWNLLAIAWSIIYGEEAAPGVTHARPPFTELQFWIMIVISLSGTMLAVYYCFSSYSRRQQAKKLK